jgi:hypothetical protein
MTYSPNDPITFLFGAWDLVLNGRGATEPVFLKRLYSSAENQSVAGLSCLGDQP